MFEKATRLRLRFDTPQGQVSTEDLWTLPLTHTNAAKANLDNIAKDLHKQIKETGEVASFVDDTKKSNEELQLKFDVVMHVINVKKEERNAALAAQERSAQKQQLLELIQQKKNEQLAGKSLDELVSMVNNLG